MSGEVDCESSMPAAPRAVRVSTDFLVPLVRAAAKGDQQAWRSLVAHFSPLVSGVIARYRLNSYDADDVAQFVWMRLFEKLEELREPRALPGWLFMTTKREALRVVLSHARTRLVDPQDGPEFEVADAVEVDDDLLRVERHRALQQSLTELEPKHRELLQLLFSDQTVPYRQISTRLGIPSGSIGPTRVRCLRRLRATSAMQALAS